MVSVWGPQSWWQLSEKRSVHVWSDQTASDHERSDSCKCPLICEAIMCTCCTQTLQGSQVTLQCTILRLVRGRHTMECDQKSTCGVDNPQLDFLCCAYAVDQLRIFPIGFDGHIKIAMKCALKFYCCGNAAKSASVDLHLADFSYMQVKSAAVLSLLALVNRYRLMKRMNIIDPDKPQGSCRDSRDAIHGS